MPSKLFSILRKVTISPVIGDNMLLGFSLVLHSSENGGPVCISVQNTFHRVYYFQAVDPQNRIE